jgi:hypothetical protein
VPVSGGKDSTFQILEMHRRGVRVLAVNSATDFLSDVGRRNLDNLKSFADVIEVTPEIGVRRRLVRAGLELVGDLSYPEHNAIWAIPTRIAVSFGVPLIVWGEQPQREYACPHGVQPPTELTSDWVAEFGGMAGLRLSDLVESGAFTSEELQIYQFPDSKTLDRVGVKGVWLGDYVDWDGWKNAFIAKQYGFETLPHVVEQSLADYENLDNYVTVLRDWLRFCKFGYARATDIACNHIRRGRLTREEAAPLVEKAEVFPHTSLGKPIQEVLDYFGLTREQFITECDRWTNKGIFESDGSHILKTSSGVPIFKGGRYICTDRPS